VLSQTAPKIADALVAIGLSPEATGIAVAVNMEVVPRSLWGEVILKSGDAVEVITARQGG
jgi:sulfur carrier protein